MFDDVCGCTWNGSSLVDFAYNSLNPSPTPLRRIVRRYCVRVAVYRGIVAEARKRAKMIVKQKAKNRMFFFS